MADFMQVLTGLKNNNEKKKLISDSFRSGRVPLTGKKFTWNDAISANNHLNTALPEVVSEIAREAAEPLLVLTQLLTPMPYTPRIEIVMGASGIVNAKDLGELEEYPEVQLSMGGQSRAVKIGKTGLKFKVSEEMIRYDEMNIIAVYLDACGKALARHKETKVAKAITSLGVQVFDNAEPSNTLLGVTHGRDSAGNPNGSLTWDDMFDLFSTVIINGFMPNLLAMHPLSWIMFMKDPLLRTFALASGSGTWWGSYNGNPVARAPWEARGLTGPSAGSKIVPAGVQSSPTQLSGMPHVNTMNSSPNFPSHMLPWPFTVVVSPFIYYDVDSKLTDIIVADRNEIGFLLVDENITVSEWEDMSRDVFFVKLRERYSIAIKNEGIGLAVARNIALVPNEIVLPARTTFDVSSLPAIPATTPVV